MPRARVPMLAFGFAALLPLAAQSLPGDRVIVAGERIGAAELESGDQGALVRQLGEPDQSRQQGDHEFYRYGEPGGQDELVMDFDLAKDEPFEISTASASYRTAQGLGVGSPQAAISSALGQPLCQGRNDRGDELIVYDSIWFLTTHGAVSKIGIRKHMSPEDFRTGPVHC